MTSGNPELFPPPVRLSMNDPPAAPGDHVFPTGHKKGTEQHQPLPLQPAKQSCSKPFSRRNRLYRYFSAAGRPDPSRQKESFPLGKRSDLANLKKKTYVLSCRNGLVQISRPVHPILIMAARLPQKGLLKSSKPDPSECHVMSRVVSAVDDGILILIQ